MHGIHGAGGGGGGGTGSQHTPVEAPDTLISRQYVKVVDIIHEGVGGDMLNGLASVYLDGVPVISSDGTPNFKGISFDFRSGTVDQSPIPGYESVSNEVAVGVRVLQGQPVVRTISGDLDEVVVTLGFPAMTSLTPQGDRNGATVEYQIAVDSAGGGYKNVPMQLVTVDGNVSGSEGSVSSANQSSLYVGINFEAYQETVWVPEQWVYVTDGGDGGVDGGGDGGE